MTIEEICEDFNIRNYTINSDGSIDVSGNVIFNNDFMVRIPLKFNKVYGNFTIMHINLNNLDELFTIKIVRFDLQLDIQ